jgi:hypothetical protein
MPIYVKDAGQWKKVGGGGSGDYRTPNAQYALSGGGLVTWTGSYVKWDQRVIAIPVERDEFSATGYIDITCPTSGTVTYYNSANVTTTLTCNTSGIPLGAWQALYYQVTLGQANTSDQTKFRVVDYRNSTWSPGEGWLLIAAVNGDTGTSDGHLKWLPGQINLPSNTGATVTYDSGTGAASWVVGPTNGGTFAGDVTFQGLVTTQKGINDVTGTGGALRIELPGGAAYASGGPITGSIKIRLPVLKSSTNTMLMMRIKVYEYNGDTVGTSRIFEIGGYNYAPGGWYNVFACQTSMNGVSAVNVRYGYDAAGYSSIWIGETNTIWQYPQVFVTEFEAGYSGYAASTWASNWAITFESSFNTVETGPITASLSAAPATNITVTETGYCTTAPISASGTSITIDTVSNAYGKKYVSTADPSLTSTVCNGDIWFDPSGSSDSSPLSSVGSNNQVIFKNSANIATGSGNLQFDGNDLLMNGNFILNSGPKFTTRGFNFELKDGILTPTNKTKLTYAYTGANQSFVVPAGINWIFVKLWGAGGGAGRIGGWSWGADGGGGGHVKGLFPVTPGSTIILVVGRGGTIVNGTTQSYGGGGTNGSAGDNSYAGHGGGYCGVFVTSVSQANALAIAGGGGGGGSSRVYNGNIGGAGGGLVGQRGASPYDGKFTSGGNPGTQSAGGGGGVGTNAGGAGSALQGGAGAAASYGGGGGGGYFGGGGGGYSETNTMAGGGGGSGFVKSTGLLLGTYTGNYRMVAYPMDPDLLTTTTDIELPGYGGQNTGNNQAAGSQSGGHAYAVLYY